MSSTGLTPGTGSVQRGQACTLEQFQNWYNLEKDEAVRLYTKFGPSDVDLRVIMTAKGYRKAATENR